MIVRSEGIGDLLRTAVPPGSPPRLEQGAIDPAAFKRVEDRRQKLALVGEAARIVF